MSFKISRGALHLWTSATNHLRARGARSLPPKPLTRAETIFNSAASPRLSDAQRGSVSPLGGQAVVKGR
jgi:hypothetical protein